MTEKTINNNGYDYVDLNLPSGTLWATCNVGASKPSEYGLYFQWGDVKGYTAEQVGVAEEQKPFNWNDYKWYESRIVDVANIKFKKYTAGGATLKLDDDAAHIYMGGDWHMPTPEQIKALIDNTTHSWGWHTHSWEWHNLDDVKGMRFTSKQDTSKSIFIPAAGFAFDGSVHDIGNEADIWSSMLDKSYINYGQYLLLTSGYVCLDNYYHCCGFPVRGVIG